MPKTRREIAAEVYREFVERKKNEKRDQLFKTMNS